MTDAVARQPLADAAPGGDAEGAPEEKVSTVVRLARAFARRGFWALSDQAVLSAGNLATSWVLINYLPTKAEWAIYGLILGTIFFLNSLHASLVSYPLSLNGANAGPDVLRRLTRRCTALTGALVIPLSSVLIGVTIYLGRADLIPWVLLALVCWQLQETTRRALLAKLRHRDALLGDAVSYFGQAAWVAALWLTESLTLRNTFIAIGLTSLLGFAVQAVQLRIFAGWGRGPRASISSVVAEHWNYGRWLVAIALISIITIQAMPWTLSHGAQGLIEAANFQALAFLLGVANPIVTSVVGLIVPAAAIAYREGGMSAAHRVARDYGLIGAVLLFPFFVVLALFPHAVLQLFTQGQHDSYAGLTVPLQLFVAAYALTYPTQIVIALLNGLGHSRSALIAQVAFAGVTLAVSLPLAAVYGLPGAVWGGLFPPIAYGAVSFWLLRRTRVAMLPEASGDGAEEREFEARAGAAGTLPAEGVAQ